MTDRQTATWTGILFITATAFLFLGEAFYKQIIEAPDALQTIAARKPTIFFGILIEYVCILAMPLIGIVIFPVLKRFSEVAALAYLFFRALEAAILISVGQINKAAMIELSEAAIASPEHAATFQQIATAAFARNAWGDTAGSLYVLTFAIGALFLYTTLYRFRLIPRLLSAWGFLAAISIAIAVLLDRTTDMPPEVGLALLLPIAVQEMVMAVWLIVKGFDAEALAKAQQ